LIVAETRTRWGQAVGGGAVAGFPVGVLCLETRHGLLPGNVQHAASFAQPVIYQTVAVENVWDLLDGDPGLSGKVLDGALQLVARGVGAVAGACGSFGYYQREVAAGTPVPTFLSIMTQAPFLQQALGPAARLGVICAARSSMNDRLFAACGITDVSSLSFHELIGCPEFDRMLRAEGVLDAERLCGEVVGVARKAVVEDPGVSAFLLQCSDLPPFAADIQAATGRPVFDMTLLINWLQAAAAYPRYA
jgi:hypothetical protein